MPGEEAEMTSGAPGEGVPATGAGTSAPVRIPVHRFTVLYDAQCSLCVHVRHWLRGQRQLVPLELVPAASEEARRRFPGLDHAATLEEITVVGDQGQVYLGAAAWVVCLWALADHRPKAHWLSSPAGRPFARGAVLAAAKYRSMTAEACSPGGACAVPVPETGG